jgi:MFS family permease
MTVGVPGTGIGGIFYILAALLAPIRGSVRRRNSSRAERGALARLFLLGLGVVVGIFATGWMLGFLIGPVAGAAAAAGARGFSRPEMQNVVRWAALFASTLMLALVLLAVQVARLIVRKKRS